MVGPGAQRNKPHKSGRRAGKSAREKHQDKKDASQRLGVKASHTAHGKADRLNAAKQQRDRRRAELLESRRTVGAPRVVALLSLSADVDVRRVWSSLLAACSPAADGGTKSCASEMDTEAGEGAGGASLLLPCDLPYDLQTLGAPDRRRVRFTFLPPPADRSDPLAIVDLGRCAEMVLFLLPGGAGSTAIDADGLTALGVLRALGMPSLLGLVQTGDGSAAAAGLKERSAAKKRAVEALLAEVPGDHRVMAADSEADFKQVVRQLADSAHSVPHWRRQRPQLLAHAAEFVIGEGEGAGTGTLLLSGYVRGLGLSANQLLHVPGAGDFQIDQIERLPEADAACADAVQRRLGRAGPSAMEAEGAGALGVARSDPAAREQLVRENQPDLLDAEQTWPTEEELAEAEEDAARAKARRRRLPRGTSEYQAAWILDDDVDYADVSDSEDDGNGSDMSALPDLESNAAADAVAPGSDSGDDAWQHADAATEVGMEYEEGEGDPEAALAELRSRRAAQADDALFPDEVETPLEVAARLRFARYQGLKSFRTSPWDPREELPADYARVFAFENVKRAHKRARAAAATAGAPGDAAGVGAGTYVRVAVAGLPADVGRRVAERVAAAASGAAPPLTAWGLLQHECKLSVVNFTMRKVAAYPDPVANKEELLLVTGLRSFTARPVLSSDEHGADKHKMQRFLHDGQAGMGTVYAPISYPPLPLLAFKLRSGAPAVLAATGSVRECNPDRVVLKKIVLTGFPVRVHKSKAVVRFMFHTPEDVRWFRPVELWTKSGRRGRIREPVGTHGTMKAIFDGPVSQQDAICMALYKRVYPKWPQSATFA